MNSLLRLIGLEAEMLHSQTLSFIGAVVNPHSNCVEMMILKLTIEGELELHRKTVYYVT
jgi:hypothetical protein